jgi:hypothetical protein
VIPFRINLSACVTDTTCSQFLVCCEGTIVEAIFIGKKRERVRSLGYLIRKYNCASTLERSLRLVFKTPLVDSALTLTATGDKHWTHDGQWIGEDLGGWDGARNEHQSLASNRPRSEMTTMQGGQAGSAPKKLVRKVSLKTAQMSLGKEACTLTDTGTSGTKPLKRKKRNVSFGESNVLIIENRGEVPTTVPLKHSIHDRFWHAVNHQTCKDLIEALEGGASQDPQVLTFGIRDGYSTVKDMLDRVETSVGFNPTNEKLLKDQKDLIAKKKVLSIYSNASVWLEKALNLQHWACFELTIVHADFRFTDDTWKGLPTNAMVSGEITTAVRGENRTREKLVSALLHVFATE